jgi:signal transduction histidine kinase
VARYGAARRERLDEVVRDIADSTDVEGVLLERDDGRERFAHGELPAVIPREPGLQVTDQTVLVTGPVRIETLGCLEVPSNTNNLAVPTSGPACCAAASGEATAPHEPRRQMCCSDGAHEGREGCWGGDASGLDGQYVVALALNATPYLRIRRSVQWQGAAGGLVLVALAGALWRHQRQTRRHARMQQALAIADERAQYLERLSLVAGGLAHEIKNPIGSLRGFAQLIAEKMAAGSPESEYANLMVSELDSITRRVDGLRHFAHPTPPVLRAGNPVEIVQRVAVLLGPDIAARNLVLRLDLPEPPGPEAEFDADRLRDLVVNLLINAIEASPPGGSIRVRLSLDAVSNQLTFEVADEGPGIPAQDRQSVLRPFQSTKSGGLGLGLALAQRAVEDHRGRLDIGDAPGGGALVQARWPRGARP